MSKKHLVIVESPAKAKTIGKYLGSEYTVKACMGHLRDLPKSTIGVDIENDFTPEYKPIRGKEEIIRELKKAAKEADTVYLATDPDREGEAISWHLQTLLELPEDKTRRVTFDEITRKVVTEAVANPRSLNEDLVDAQQARRILDRVVGYQISPIMWKKIRPQLSAGRVQSVATRMVDDRDREIAEFVPQEYWSLDALLQKDVTAPFKAHYHGVGGKKKDLNTEADVRAITEALQSAAFTVTAVKRSDKQRSPSPPFTTSTLQQEASRKVNMTPRRTMAIAQQLYEGVDITGVGTVGLITYMRTDSLRISAEAQSAARSFITERYGKAYCPAKARQYKAKGAAQDAHEAIRPSDVTLTPENIRGDLTAEQYQLYRLIWSRFLASQMENAVYDTLSVEIGADVHSFRCSASRLKFSGFSAVYEDSRDDEDKEEKEPALPELNEGDALTLKGFEPAQHFTQPPAHYTEATLIRAMEENGIGRPSTYAPTVSTILDRRYVKKEGKHLLITNLGKAVTAWMKKYFTDIADLKFTAQMEQHLDDVAEGNMQWKQVLRSFYEGGFANHLDEAAAGEYMRPEPTVSEEICPVCGKNLVEREGRFGPFLACPGFPDCTFTMPLVVEMPGRCPKCGGRLFKRTGTSKSSGKQYNYYCCEFTNSKFTDRHCDFMTWDVPTKEDCPSCGHTMFKRSGRGNPRPFCINETCSNFLPEDKRGYLKKKTEGEAETAEKKSAGKSGTKKTAEKKTTTKKSAAKKAATKKETK
ncbi:MAG: type I DNA topoisomerase [Oscillospiraceae bacterium]|nr:type I DNA topoisomerase [Oscillospiraceae bacterium]